MAGVTQLCADLSAGDQKKAYHARRELLMMAGAAGAEGKQAEKAKLAKELAAALAALKPAKDVRGEPTLESIRSVEGATDLCRALAIVAGDEEVSAIKSCLANVDLREAARWCLARMSAPAATDALVEALVGNPSDKPVAPAVGTEFRVGLVNALAGKSGSGVIDALKAAAGDPEPEVRLAAAEALAELPQAAVDAVIASVDPGSSSRGAARVARARIRLGNTLARSGDKEGARGVFQGVAGSAADEAQKKAAAAALATLG